MVDSGRLPWRSLNVASKRCIAGAFSCFSRLIVKSIDLDKKNLNTCIVDKTKEPSKEKNVLIPPFLPDS